MLTRAVGGCVARHPKGTELRLFGNRCVAGSDPLRGTELPDRTQVIEQTRLSQSSRPTVRRRGSPARRQTSERNGAAPLWERLLTVGLHFTFRCHFSLILPGTPLKSLARSVRATSLQSLTKES
jgi:hypothetical protein